MPLANAQGSVCGEKIPFFSGFPVQLHTPEQWELVEGHFFGGGGGEWESYKSIHYFVDKKKKNECNEDVQICNELLVFCHLT